MDKIVCDTNFVYYLLGLSQIPSKYDSEKINLKLKSSEIYCPNTVLIEIIVSNFLRFGYQKTKDIIAKIFDYSFNFANLEEIGYVKNMPKINSIKKMVNLDEEKFILEMNRILEKKVEIEITFIMMYIQYIVALYTYICFGKDRAIVEAKNYARKKDMIKNFYKSVLIIEYQKIIDKNLGKKISLSDRINVDLYYILSAIDRSNQKELLECIKKNISVTNIFKKIDKKFVKGEEFTNGILANDISCLFNELGGRYFILLFLQLVMNCKKFQKNDIFDLINVIIAGEKADYYLLSFEDEIINYLKLIEPKKYGNFYDDFLK